MDNPCAEQGLGRTVLPSKRVPADITTTSSETSMAKRPKVSSASSSGKPPAKQPGKSANEPTAAQLKVAAVKRRLDMVKLKANPMVKAAVVFQPTPPVIESESESDEPEDPDDLLKRRRIECEAHAAALVLPLPSSTPSLLLARR